MIDIDDLMNLEICEECKCVFDVNDRKDYIRQRYCRNCQRKMNGE